MGKLTDILKEYDSNLINHLQKINQLRQTPIRLKYYQYFSLLFTEFFLDKYFEDKHDLKDKLNAFIATSTKADIRSLPHYTEDDLNKLAYWNATGSGKTFILHINILQFRHYAQKYGVNFKNVILLTPNEKLSKQHLEDLENSGIAANLYWEDKESNTVKVTDIHKIREYATGSGVTIPLSEFDRNNAIFVDEGHKGNRSEDSQWREIRSTLSEQGFAFEYSATFGQLSDETLLKEYAKCIAFDYSYGHFWEDGYGKDYWIHNLSSNEFIQNQQKKFQYLLQNLLLFVQQKTMFAKHPQEMLNYEIENPLLIFVGSSVEPKPNKSQAKENEEVISDVKTVLDFFNDFLQNRTLYIQWINELKNHTDNSLFKEDYYSKLQFLFTELPDAAAIYQFCLKSVFNTNTGDELELYTLKNINGEIGLKVKGSDYYFALIYIGATSDFKSPIENQYTFKHDISSSSLFDTLSDKNSNAINILIGARKFIEGWNNYRVSSIGLINFGKSKGSQIIQLFGRGVRLRGKGGSLKRSKNTPGALKGIDIVETLNIFGLDAGYMRQFRDDLEKEGIKTLKRNFTFDIKVTHNLNQIQLLTLERDSSAPRFESTNSITLTNEPSIKVRLDISTKKFVAQSGQRHLEQSTNTVQYQLSDAFLDIVDWDFIYTELLLFKKRATSPRMVNLLIPRTELRAILKQINYRIIADGHSQIQQLEDFDKLNKLVLQVFKQYIQLFYKRHLRNYDGNNLTTKVLTEDNANIRNAQWEFEVITTDANQDELQGIQNILTTIAHLADNTTNYPEKLKNNTFLLNEWLDAHLYQPLFKNEDNQPNTTNISSIKPAGLNTGEFHFVEDLRNFIASQGSRYPDYDFYLLRNMSRGTGFGFYFLSGGFYPDFMLWLKHKTSGKQYLTFIDPHGLRNEQERWDSPKITLFETIKDLQAQLANPNLVLNSFILQPPPEDLATTGLNGWHREDDTLRQIALDDYAAGKNVFAIPTVGNESGQGGYIDIIVQKIIGSE